MYYFLILVGESQNHFCHATVLLLFLLKRQPVQVEFIKLQVLYTGTLDPENFSGAVFTHAHFQKRPKYPAYAIFHYISLRINLIVHF